MYGAVFRLFSHRLPTFTFVLLRYFYSYRKYHLKSFATVFRLGMAAFNNWPSAILLHGLWLLHLIVPGTASSNENAQAPITESTVAKVGNCVRAIS